MCYSLLIVQNGMDGVPFFTNFSNYGRVYNGFVVRTRS